MPASDAVSRDKLAKLTCTPKPAIILDVRCSALRDEGTRPAHGALLTDDDMMPSDATALLCRLSGLPVMEACAAGHGRSQWRAASVQVGEGLALRHTGFQRIGHAPRKRIFKGEGSQAVQRPGQAQPVGMPKASGAASTCPGSAPCTRRTSVVCR